MATNLRLNKAKVIAQLKARKAEAEKRYDADVAAREREAQREVTEAVALVEKWLKDTSKPLYVSIGTWPKVQTKAEVVQDYTDMITLLELSDDEMVSIDYATTYGRPLSTLLLS